MHNAFIFITNDVVCIGIVSFFFTMNDDSVAAAAYGAEARAHFASFVRDRHGITKGGAHRDKVQCVAWNALGTRLASASSDKTAAVYSIRGRLVCDLCCSRGHDGINAPTHTSFLLRR